MKQGVLVITHVTVIDATGAPARPDTTVVITGGRITEMGESNEIRPPKNAEIVNATRKFLIPGLWDMHVHWYEKDYLPLFIANGVTGIRIMWGMPINHQWGKEIEAGQLLGPHMLIASTPVDGPKPVWPGSITVANASEARQAVIQAKRDGDDFIKVYSLLPRDAYFAIADESKKQGIPFEGHVPISVSAEEASNAGQKSIEHLTGVLPACSNRAAELLKSSQEALAAIIAGQQPPVSAVHGAASRKWEELTLETYSPQKAEALFAELKKNQTWQCPTLTVLRGMAFLDDPSFTNDSRLKYMPRNIRASWDPRTDFRLKTRTAEGWALSKKVFSKDAEIVGAMQRAGVNILAGTDTLNPYCFPGFSLHDELGLLVKAGLSPMEALQAATLNPARFMGKEKDLGTVETGKIADLVLLDANPLDDIANTKRIDAVVLGGKFFPRMSLDGMLAKVEALASRKSIAEALMKTIQEQDVEAAVKQYHELKATEHAAYDFGEDELIGLGYQLLEMKKFKDAIRVFELNVEAYPSSYNAYDSLGEAYMDDGDKERAIKNYKKSLELNPSNSNAVEKLKKLSAP
ncbi:MAG TPA: amidohydrolase family protein [Candidatus Acidoferrales bacterium]|nr:amidohydrolase family protein [Candidatus Acidoferrales bacterium]